MDTGEKKEPLVLALDIGGTKILAALITSNGQMVAREYYRTHAEEGLQAVINRMFSAIDHLLNLENITADNLEAISIAAAGAIDMENGIITTSPNLPGWDNVPLPKIIQEKYEVNTLLINDANAAAIGEHRVGAGKGTTNLIFVTVSTGIGGGIIINNEPYFGSSGSAGEVGHMTIDSSGPRCNCGNIGCLEILASGTAIARDMAERIAGGEKSSVREMVEGRLGNITAEEVSKAAKEGDSLSLSVIDKAARYLGIGLANLVNIFNPDIIVVGGGVVKMDELLLEPAREVVRESAFKMASTHARIVPAQLGDEAGVIGAAIYAFRNGAGG